MVDGVTRRMLPQLSVAPPPPHLHVNRPLVTIRHNLVAGFFIMVDFYLNY